jgi:hypothetical protein
MRTNLCHTTAAAQTNSVNNIILQKKKKGKAIKKETL